MKNHSPGAPHRSLIQLCKVPSGASLTASRALALPASDSEWRQPQQHAAHGDGIWLSLHSQLWIKTAETISHSPARCWSCWHHSKVSRQCLASSPDPSEVMSIAWAGEKPCDLMVPPHSCFLPAPVLKLRHLACLSVLKWNDPNYSAK